MINTKRQAPVSTATLPILLEAIEDPAASAASVAEVVSLDNGLAARVLGLANSAQFGLSRTVSELDMAVGLVGTSMVQTLAIASAAALLDRRGAMAESQQHAFEVAAAAKLIAPLAEGVRPSDAFAAGLLHDIGELLLLQARPTEYAELRSSFSSHAQQLRLEQEHFDVDHALVGAEHLLEWRVPDVIADAVADHHCPLPDSPGTTIVVAAADELVEDEDDRCGALQQLGIDEERAADLRARIVDEVAELSAALLS